jgi:hypothetical protein
MQELEFIELNVTCHTDGCINKNIALKVICIKSNPHVICGPCGIQIEDVIPVG